jgi:WhiB family transcriptional regulator, redox-sensing transcriptional regulator
VARAARTAQVSGTRRARVAQDKPPVRLWRTDDAACRGADIGLFYPEGPRAANLAKKAVAICSGCPVKAECLEVHMDEEQNGGGRYGIKGALTAEERRALQKKRTRKNESGEAAA